MCPTGKGKEKETKSVLWDCHNVSLVIEKRGTGRTGGSDMKGYFVYNGYMGMVEGRYMLFASEEDYLDYLEN